MKIFKSKKDERIKELEQLCEAKDELFLEVISDGLRKGSSKAAEYMADRKAYLKRKGK